MPPIVSENGLGPAACAEEICMVEADSLVVWDQFNTEGPKGHVLCPRGPSWPCQNRKLLGQDSRLLITTHV